MLNCDYCGCEIQKGEETEVLDENYNKTGCYECKKCYGDNIADLDD